MLSALAASPIVLAALVSGRIAIVASSSVADGQAALRYAGRDADQVADVLRELGGFDQVVLLHEPTPTALRDAFERADRLARADPRLELLVYYSGHADGRGLLLGREGLDYQELRRLLEQSRALVRVAVLDACHSGGVVRTKGGQPAAEFPLPAPTSPPPVQGAAILAASTATELAQESSEIEGSYFTHHMLSALRGAGDRDDNGLVTLGEAYEYAYGRTVAATMPSLWGPQHPSFDVRLTGAGELVLTNLQRGGRALWLPAGQGSTYHIATRDNRLVAEMAARPTRRSRLIVRPGRYRVIRRQDHRAFVAEVEVGNADVQLAESKFTEVNPELALAKGGHVGGANEVFVDVALSGLGPGLLNSTSEVGGGWFRRGVRWSFGPHLSYGRVEGTTFDVQYQLSRLTASGYGLRRIRMPFTELQLGLALGLTAIRQIYAGETHAGVGPLALAVLALDVPLAERIGVRLSWAVGSELLKLGDRYRLVPEARAALALSYRF